MTHSDHRLGWTLPALPLGPAIKRGTLRDDPEWKAAMRLIDFETKDYSVKGAAQDEPAWAEMPRTPVAASPTGVWQPKAGDRVRVTKFGGGRMCVGDLGTIKNDRLHLDKEPETGWAFVAEWLEPTPTASTPTDGEWVEHTGFTCPVPADAFVEVRYRSGGEGCRTKDKAGSWVTCWEQDHGASITHYRIVKS